jgi:Trk-type K+ transport system membrane component
MKMDVGYYFDPAVYIPLWQSIFTTISTAANLGFMVFVALVGIAVFKFVANYFF